MKKLCLLLALVLALSTIPAFAAQGDMLLGRDEEYPYYFNYGFPMGDSLGLASGNTMYVFRLGSDALEEHQIEVLQQESGSALELFPFAVNGELYAIGLATQYGEQAEFEGATLYRMVPGEEQAYGLEEAMSLDWDNLTEFYGSESYATRPEGVIGVGGRACFRAYDASGAYRLYVLDVDTGRIDSVDGIDDLYNMTPYREGTLLVQCYSYERPGETRLLAYDPEAESIEPVAEMEIDEYSPLDALAYDAETDTLYCARAGELHPVDLSTGEIGEGVTDMPLETYGGSAAYVLTGGYYVYCGEGLVVRNLDPDQRSDTRLKITDTSWEEAVTTAYYHFANAHGDVNTVLSHDYNEAQNLLENMMNRDDSVDIYVMSSTSSIYDALYRRGYLMELDGSEKLAALADRMYPQLREAVSAGGHLVALPVTFNSWTLGVNEKPLEALGYALEDVPDNWMDLLAFIANLEQPLKEHPNVHLFYAGYTAREARNDLFNSLFEDYERYINAVNPDMGYNSPLLRELLTRLEQIDFVALGCAEDRDDEDDNMGVIVYEDYNEDSVLFSTGIGASIGSFYSSYTPLLLGLDAATPLPLVLRADLAFINPYTKNPDLALEFLEEVADNLSLATLYTMDPSLNEPVRGPHGEENLAEAREWVARAQQELDEAEAADRQAMEESLKSAQDNLEYWETYGWDVSQREIDWLRSHDDDLAMDRVNWLYADDSGDAWDLINQYLDGAISMDEMLSGVDRKAQMMRLEGN